VTWARLDDRMPDNPKILSVSLGARWALIELWCYCAGQETDGLVPDSAAARRATKKQLAELEQVTLIHRNGSGWLVNDWLVYNISAADAKKKRDDAAERKRKWRDAHRNGNGTFDE
jgi:hypothetical protein